MSKYSEEEMAKKIEELKAIQLEKSELLGQLNLKRNDVG